MSNLVKINLFGELGTFVGSTNWELDISSVSEAINAINVITENKFKEFFIKKNKLQAKYRVLINGRDFDCPEQEINEKNWQLINSSELVMKKNNLETIDIVPLIENSGTGGAGIFTAILGGLLIVAGIILSVIGFGAGTPLIVAGIGLLAGGVVALLSKPPQFAYNQSLDGANSQSYLFNGPVNTIGEGGPVPVGYGTLLVGSNVISAGYKVTQYRGF